MEATNGNTRVLKVLQGGGYYGTIDLVKLANVADPHKNISYLMAKGYLIKSEWRKGNKTRYKVWHLQASTPQTDNNNKNK